MPVPSAIEKNYRTRSDLKHSDFTQEKRGELTIACGWINFAYTPAEERRMVRMWNAGKTIFEMSDELVRPSDDVFVIAWDLLKHGKVKNRPGGIMG